MMTPAPEAPAVTLYVPGLYGGKGWPKPPPAALTHILARTHRAPGGREGYASRALALFDLPPSAGLAGLARLGEGCVRDDRWWVRCDPVHLAVDGDRLLLLDNDTLTLEAHEAQRLSTRVASVFAVDGGTIEALAPTRWYLSLPNPEPLHAIAIAEVAGRNIHDYLPAGHARYWRTRLNEAQMVLHEALSAGHGGEAGRGEANSIWLWGPGHMPPPAKPAFTHVLTDDVLIRGMAQVTGADGTGLPAGVSHVDYTHSTLIVLRGAQGAVQYGDTEAWTAFLEAFVTAWWKPLAAAVRDRRLARLSLIGDGGPRHILEPGWWRAFTRRWR